MDAIVGVVTRSFISKYYDISVIPTADNGVEDMDTIWPGMDPESHIFFRLILQKISHFVQGYPVAHGAVVSEHVLGKDVRRQRQKMMQQQVRI